MNDFSQIYNIVIVGVGGQGTILASKVLAQAALNMGAFVRSAETIGMAQRGGSVLGHIRIAKDSNKLHSPLVPLGGAHLILGFEPAEAVRATTFANAHSTIICSDMAVPATNSSLSKNSTKAKSATGAGTSGVNAASALTNIDARDKGIYNGKAELDWLYNLAANNELKQVIVISSDELIAQTGSAKCQNIALIGAATALGLFSADIVEATIKSLVKPQFLQMNMLAFKYGIEQCRKMTQGVTD
ncbi:MAG: 2-oxoacid:acceptor oxidoreductase family protein [Coriobacteriales bacterium]|jgi:indolepyruvate ferredoxin oxidoreductase beta subunit|nr:2-oxoacid:acceptor oxidoreductase family protein [Coriobacteriales bacterium]